MPLGNHKILNFGTDDELDFFFSDLFKHREKIEISELKQWFARKYSLTNFEEILFFLTEIGLLEKSPRLVKKVKSDFWESDDKDQYLLKKIISKLKKTNELKKFFKPDLIRFDEGKLFFMHTKTPREFTALSKFLIQRKILRKEQDDPYFFIDDIYIEIIFDGGLAIPRPYFDKSISQEELDTILEKKNKLKKKYGNDAEKWVLDFERSKFSGKVSSHLFERIERISEQSAGAGFDIISIKSENSLVPDKFIEVKSFGDERKFYWSINEMKVAREKRYDYFIYLIDRNEMDSPNYKPIEIKNPAEKILNGTIIEDKLKFVNESESIVVEAENFIFNF
jgi:hypothetical protein